MDSKKFEVPVDQLCWKCDTKQFTFKCTADLAPLHEFIGQDRAVRAVEFGLAMPNNGYNIYMAGLSGTGKTTIVKSYIDRLIKERKDLGDAFKAEDWCYIYNFKDVDRPQIVNLPQGEGKKFRDQVSHLLDEVKEQLGRTFMSEEYNERRKKLVEEGRGEQQKVFEEIADEARRQGFALQMTQMGPVVVPMIDSRPMEDKEYLALDEKKRKQLEAKQAELLKKLQSGFERATNVQRGLTERLNKFDREVGEYVISGMLSPLARDYGEVPKVKDYFDGLKTHILDNLEVFKSKEEPIHPAFGVPMSQATGKNPFLPFQVNVFIDNTDSKGPPVIIESNPNFGNMFGKIERRFLFGGYLSDHTMLKAGAISRANGGYLLVSATEVITNPGVWPTLKRTIKEKEARIEDPYEQFGLIAPQGMRPEPMPVNVKIVLIGDPRLYQALSTYDEEFWEIFKVKADFANEIDRNSVDLQDYAAFVAGCCDECKTRPFDTSGVAKIIEYSTRMVADQDKLSTRFGQIKEWVEEAEYWAKKEGSQYINAGHVKKAMDEKIFRHNLIDERIREMIARGTIMIDTEGAVAGQVNGLSVYSLGDAMFGRPSRITAKTFLGRSGVINIERESQLSGPIHNKGVMILSGYLGWKYAQSRPLSLSASLCFEQSYEGIEGDSASSTELYAILSSLSGVPIKQGIAVTGSVNQKGEVQPIGGVNHKIEGFFHVCQAKGLTGDQGVMIPYQNLKNLMLREDVVEAVQQGKFHIYSVKTIDEGIEVLTGVPAGERQADGTYPEGSVNFLVDRCLKEYSERMKSFAAEEKKEGKQEAKTP